MSTARTDKPQQAAAIAVRRKGDDREVCLIRKKGSSDWGIPKGIIDPGETQEDTVLNEAWEEAGLKGRLLGDAIGTYEYEKWQTTFVVAVYVMEVLEQSADWEEAGIRERRWTSFDEAAVLLVDHPVRVLLDQARNVVGE